MYERELTALAAGATLVTANNRLARTLRHAYNQSQLAAGAAAWRAPQILPWSVWLTELWQAARLSGGAARELRLLSSTAADLLWRQIVVEASAADGPATQLAQGAREAWQRLNDWQGLTAADWTAPDLSRDQVAFLRWSGAYRNQCQAAGWVDTERLPELLAADVTAGRVPRPERLIFAGFDTWPPARLALREAFAAAGTAVELSASGRESAAPQGRPCASADAEIWAAARWARARLEAEPDARVGLVVPDLAVRAAQVRRICLDVLAPDWRLQGVPDKLPLNVSYGQPLAEVPVVTAALRLLDFAGPALDFDTLSLVLRSPWLGGAAAEASARAALELRLRRRLRVEFSLATLRGELGEATPVFAAQLEQLVDHLAGATAAGSPSHPVSYWAQWFADLPQCLGWPGDAPLDSAAFQATQAWNRLLGDFAAHSAVLGELPLAAACGVLRNLAQQTVFQPEGTATGLQVMGVLEAAGHEFDHLWVAGMARELWPAPQRPNPFIPVRLQRRLGMPDASAAAALELAERQTRRLLSAAPAVCVSWPLELDGEQLGPSPLLGRLAGADELEPAAGGWNAAVFGSCPRELLRADLPPPLAAGTRARGGSAVLSKQAVSPINAFMETRLGAAEIELPAAGLSPLHKGNLTHAALEVLYTAAPSQRALAALDPAERDALLLRGLRRAARRVPGSADPFMRRLLEQEFALQLQRITAFLELDLQRPEFVAVATESRCEAAQVGPLVFDLRLDRLDTLTDGRQLVIDYKTGQVNRQNWNPATPGDLQLPLYVTAVVPEARGIAFAQIAALNVAYDGVGHPDLAIDGIRSPGARARIQVRYQAPSSAATIESWDELRDAWRECLLRLAAEYAAGDFRLDPRNPASGTGQFAVLSRVYDDAATFAEERG